MKKLSQQEMKKVALQMIAHAGELNKIATGFLSQLEGAQASSARKGLNPAEVRAAARRQRYHQRKKLQK